MRHDLIERLLHELSLGDETVLERLMSEVARRRLLDLGFITRLARVAPPCPEVWEVLTRALDDGHPVAALDAAVEALAPVLDAWPVALRVLPEAWWRARLGRKPSVHPAWRLACALDLSGDRYKDPAAKRLLRSEVMTSLRALLIRDAGLKSASIRSLAALDTLSAIEHLDLSGNDIITLRSLSGLVDAPHLGALSSLILQRNRLKTNAVAALAVAPFAPQLHTLDLSDNPLRTVGARALARSPALSNLETLTARGCAIPAPAAAALGDSATLTRLRALDLSRNELGDPGLAGLTRGPLWQRLTDLTLADDRLSPDAPTALLARPAPRLTHLDLSDNPISDRGCALLARAPLPALTHLTLRAIDLSDAGVDPLAHAPWRPQLRLLDLSRNTLTRPAQRRLRAALGPDALTRLDPHLADASPHADLSPEARAQRLAHHQQALDDLLTHTPDAATFAALAALLDAWPDPDTLDALIERVVAATDAWPDALCPLPNRWWVTLRRGGSEPRARLARCLRLDAWPDTRGALLRLASDPELANLRHLALHRSPPTNEGIDALIASPHIHLRHLEITDGQLSDAGLIALASSDKARDLRRLTLHNNKLSDAGLRPLLGAAPLTHLDLCSHAELDLLSALAHPEALTSLRCQAYHLTPPSDAPLPLPALDTLEVVGWSPLRALPSLETLDAPRLRILRLPLYAPEAMRHLCARSADHLTHLEITDHRGQLKALRGLRLPALTSLTLTRSTIGQSLSLPQDLFTPAALPALRRLTLRSPRDLEPLLAALSPLREQLEALELTLLLKNKNPSALDALRDLGALRELSLNLVSTSSAPLLRALFCEAACPRLTALTLNSLDLEGLPPSAAASMQRLRALCVRTPIADDALTPLIQAGALTSLERLSLDDPSRGDVEALAAHPHPALRALSITRRGDLANTPCGVSALLDSPHLPALRELTLHGDARDVTDPFGRHEHLEALTLTLVSPGLVDALIAHPAARRLRRLSLTFAPPTIDAVEALLAAESLTDLDTLELPYLPRKVEHAARQAWTRSPIRRLIISSVG